MKFALFDINCYLCIVNYWQSRCARLISGLQRLILSQYSKGSHREVSEIMQRKEGLNFAPPFFLKKNLRKIYNFFSK